MSSKLSCHALLPAIRPSNLAGSDPIKGEWNVTPGQIRGFWASISSVLNNSKYFCISINSRLKSFGMNFSFSIYILELDR